MSDFFLRQAVVKVGIPGSEGKEFSGLRVAFDVEKNSESFANPGKITIYNLNKDSRGFMEQKGLKVRLLVGYLNSLAQIYLGDIQKVKHEKSGVDWVTHIEAGDGEQAIQDATIDKSYQPGVNIKSVIGDLVGSFPGLTSGAQEGVKDETFGNGLSLTGSSADRLTEITKKQGLEWSIQDGEVQILPPTDKTKDEAILVSSETGLIGSPSKTDGAIPGIEFKCLLIPTLRPGRAVQVESKEINKAFRVRKVVFTGDNTEGEFICKCEAV